MQKSSYKSAHHLWQPRRKGGGGGLERKSEKSVSVVLLLPKSPKQFQKALKERWGSARRVLYLVASLSLSYKNEGIGADNGEAKVDEDHGALRADVPGVWEKEKDAFRW